MTIDTTKVYRVLDAQRADIREVQPETPTLHMNEALIPYPRDRRGHITVDHELVETTGELSTANFPDALRLGLQVDLFNIYNETPVTYPQFVRMVDSVKQQEEYLFDSAIGLPPIVAEGQNYPEVTTDFSHGLIIKNAKRGMIISVTEEMQRFDQVGKVRELAELLGRAMRREEEQAVMNVITTTGNYTRTNTAGDNDEAATGSGANFQAVTFSATGLIAAFNILRTMKDRKTGLYLGVRPNTLIVAPKLWWATQQLIGGNTVQRVGAASANDVYGTGTGNAFFNVVDTIIVSPEFDNSYGWALMERGRAVTFQRVDPITLIQEGRDPSVLGYFNRDVLRYRARNWYGVGMRDDRFAFLSTSTTAPVSA